MLACAHNIRDDRRSAFANRLKNYQKAGFPEGINTGRGRAASYGVGHLLQLAVALELNQLGLTPERAVAAILSDLHNVAMAAALAAKEGPPQGKFPHPTLLFLDPTNLNDLMEERGDRAVNSFRYIGLADAIDNMRKWFTGGAARVSFFSVSALLWDLAKYTTAGGTAEQRDEFYQAIESWADPIIHNVGKEQ